MTEVRNIGLVLIGGDPTDPTYISFFHGAALEATRGGQHVFCHAASDPDVPLDDALLRSSACDGFLMLGVITNDHYTLLKKIGKPIVVLGDHHISYPINDVNLSHRDAGRSAIRYLASLGHRRIALSCDDIRYLHRQEFQSGFIKGMEEAGLALQPKWMQAAPRLVPHLNVVTPLFELDEPPSAVIASSSGEARDVIDYCRSRGLRVPEDVSVMFFGHSQAPHHPDSITFLEESGGDVGRIAVQRLRALIANPDEIPLTTLLYLTLRDHRTCAAMNAGQMQHRPANPKDDKASSLITRE